MAIQLGASLSDPKFVFVQIVHTCSTFFFFLGGIRAILDVFLLVFFTGGSASVSLANGLSVCFYVSLSSLFEVTVTDMSNGSVGCFFLMHMLTAFVFSHFLALVVQRRKFVLDFVCTVYVVYFAVSCVVARRITGGGFAWWAVVAVCSCITYCVTSFCCRRRELQDIFFSSPAASAVGCNFGNTGDGCVGGDVGMTALVVTAEPASAEVEGNRFANGRVSPRTVTETVMMGPGSASKRRL